jgi:hypothetical protein
MRRRSRLGCNAGARRGSAGSSSLITEGVVETSSGRVANLRQRHGDRRRPRKDLSTNRPCPGRLRRTRVAVIRGRPDQLVSSQVVLFCPAKCVRSRRHRRASLVPFTARVAGSICRWRDSGETRGAMIMTNGHSKTNEGHALAGGTPPPSPGACSARTQCCRLCQNPAQIVKAVSWSHGSDNAAQKDSQRSGRRNRRPANPRNPEGVCSFLPQGSCAISQLLVVYQGHCRMLRSDIVDHQGRSTLP